MKLKCTIGTQGLSDGRTYHEGDEYELNDEATAKVLIALGYAVEIKTESIKAAEPTKIVKRKITRGR